MVEFLIGVVVGGLVVSFFTVTMIREKVKAVWQKIVG